MIHFFGNCEKYKGKLRHFDPDREVHLVVCNPNPPDLMELVNWIETHRVPFQMVIIPYTTKHMSYADYVLDGEPWETCQFIRSLQYVNDIRLTDVIVPQENTLRYTWPVRHTDWLQTIYSNALYAHKRWTLMQPETGLTGLEKFIADRSPMLVKSACSLCKFECFVTQTEFFRHFVNHVTHGDELMQAKNLVRYLPYGNYGVPVEKAKQHLLALLRNEEPILLSGVPQELEWFERSRVIRGTQLEFSAAWINHQVERKIREHKPLGTLAWEHRRELFDSGDPVKFVKEEELLKLPEEILQIPLRSIKPTKEEVVDFIDLVRIDVQDQ